jgi:hypothetical protein
MYDHSQLVHVPGLGNFLPRPHALAAIPALSHSHDGFARHLSGVEDGKVAAAAMGAGDAAFDLSLFLRHIHALLCSLDSLIGGFFFACVPPVPGSTTPCSDAATAQPTTQSKKWLPARCSC